MKLSTKLVIIFLAVGISPILISGIFILNKSSNALEQRAIDQLVSVRDIKKEEILAFFESREENLNTLRDSIMAWQKDNFDKIVSLREARKDQVDSYFRTIENQIITFSQNRMVVDAMQAMPELFDSVIGENDLTDGELLRMKGKLRDYYVNDFGQVYEERNQSTATVNEILDRLDRDSIALQYYYIADNPNPLGSKDNLSLAEDASAYSDYHGVIHPVIQNYLKKFGFYDIFLIDSESGDIIYSVFKELDYSTSLIDGPFANTNFAEAFRLANELENPDDFVLVDYETYTPSYEAPASFIASPIFDGDKKLGVAIFQMPIDRLNAIMSSRIGLGDTGEIYIVGQDNLMRSNSYLDSVNHSVEASFMDPDEGKIDTLATREALEGRDGSQIIESYNGNLVLSAYSPLELHGITWGFVAEIDVAEAFNPKNKDGSEFYADFIERNDYYDLFLFDPTGYCFYSVAKEADYQSNLLSGPFADSGLGELLEKVLEEKTFGIVDFAPYAPSNGDPAAFLAMPILNGSKVDLVVALQLSTAKINKIMQQRAGMGESGETYLVGPDFRMRSTSYLDPEGHSIEASFAGTIKENGVDTEAARSALAGTTGSDVIIDYTGKPVLSAYTRFDFKDIQWALLAEINQDEAFAAVRQMKIFMGVLTLIFIALVTAVSLWVSKSLSTPIMRAVNGLKAASSETSGASTQVASASQSLAEGASEQAASVEETSSSVDELGAMINRGSELAVSTNQHAVEASESASEGQLSMQELRSCVDEVTIGSKDMQSAMHEIRESSTAISKIIKTIDEIAFQTNILALNAAVEAARAGEAGAGFAVVADEVRSLAGRAADAAQQTSEMIEDSVKKSQRGVEVNEKVAHQLDEVLLKAENVEVGFAQITTKVSDVASAMRELESSSLQQKEGIQEINVALNQINDVTQSSAASAEETASSSEELNAQTLELQNILSQLEVIITGSKQVSEVDQGNLLTMRN